MLILILHAHLQKELWHALDEKFGVSDVGSELYIMKKLFDYKMVENRPVVEQAHEIHALAKELGQFPCVLPDKFVAGGIIAKLSPSWRNFATTLKHKRQEFSVAKLIGSLDVEDMARAKYTHEKGIASSSANMAQKRNYNASRTNKKKNKQQNASKPKQTTTFKKKNKDVRCFFAGVLIIGKVRAQTANLSKKRNQFKRRKHQTWFLARLEKEHRGMVIFYLLLFQCVIHLSGGLVLVLIFMCVLIFLCFLLISAKGLEHR
jgi:hypothetical protein